MSYGRVGTPEEITAAQARSSPVCNWAPFNPSNDDQLLPIRILEANKSIMKIKGDDKLSADEKAAQIAPLAGRDQEVSRQTPRKAETSAFKKQVAPFIEADKAGDQAELKKMIGEFAAQRRDRRRPTNASRRAPGHRSGALRAYLTMTDIIAPVRGVQNRPLRLDHPVPQHPLARRVRGWLGWLFVFGLLAWSWNPAEMFRVVGAVHRLAQHGGVRQRLPQSEFPRLATAISPTWW